MTADWVSLGAISHLALTVTDPSVSVPWYERVLGAEMIAEARYPERGQTLTVLRAGSTILGLSYFEDGDRSRFDERRPGLDHLSFACADREELEAWKARLEDLRVETSGPSEEPGVVLLVFRDPDGIQLELSAPSS